MSPKGRCESEERSKTFEAQRREPLSRDRLRDVRIAEQLALSVRAQVGEHEAHARLVETAPAMLGARERLVDEGLIAAQAPLELPGYVDVLGVHPHREDRPLAVERDHALMTELQPL